MPEEVGRSKLWPVVALGLVVVWWLIQPNPEPPEEPARTPVVKPAPPTKPGPPRKP